MTERAIDFGDEYDRQSPAGSTDVPDLDFRFNELPQLGEHGVFVAASYGFESPPSELRPAVADALQTPDPGYANNVSLAGLPSLDLMTLGFGEYTPGDSSPASAGARALPQDVMQYEQPPAAQQAYAVETPEAAAARFLPMPHLFRVIGGAVGLNREVRFANQDWRRAEAQWAPPSAADVEPMPDGRATKPLLELVRAPVMEAPAAEAMPAPAPDIAPLQVEAEPEVDEPEDVPAPHAKSVRRTLGVVRETVADSAVTLTAWGNGAARHLRSDASRLVSRGRAVLPHPPINGEGLIARALRRQELLERDGILGSARNVVTAVGDTAHRRYALLRQEGLRQSARNVVAIPAAASIRMSERGLRRGLAAANRAVNYGIDYGILGTTYGLYWLGDTLGNLGEATGDYIGELTDAIEQRDVRRGVATLVRPFTDRVGDAVDAVVESGMAAVDAGRAIARYGLGATAEPLTEAQLTANRQALHEALALASVRYRALQSRAATNLTLNDFNRSAEEVVSGVTFKRVDSALAFIQEIRPYLAVYMANIEPDTLEEYSSYAERRFQYGVAPEYVPPTDKAFLTNVDTIYAGLWNMYPDACQQFDGNDVNGPTLKAIIGSVLQFVADDHAIEETDVFTTFGVLAQAFYDPVLDAAATTARPVQTVPIIPNQPQAIYPDLREQHILQAEAAWEPFSRAVSLPERMARRQPVAVTYPVEQHRQDYANEVNALVAAVRPAQEPKTLGDFAVGVALREALDATPEEALYVGAMPEQARAVALQAAGEIRRAIAAKHRALEAMLNRLDKTDDVDALIAQVLYNEGRINALPDGRYLAHYSDTTVKVIMRVLGKYDMATNDPARNNPSLVAVTRGVPQRVRSIVARGRNLLRQFPPRLRGKTKPQA